LEFLEEDNEMTEAAAQAIETPANQYIEPTSFGVPNQRIKGRTPILRAANPAVNVLHDDPVPSCDVPS
jgi:hypothetical protein